MTKPLQIAWRIGFHAWGAGFWRAHWCIVFREGITQTKTNLGVSAALQGFWGEGKGGWYWQPWLVIVVALKLVCGLRIYWDLYVLGFVQIKLQARAASGLLVSWINCAAVAASGCIILNVWCTAARSSSKKTHQQEEERFWREIGWHLVNSGCCIQLCHTHVSQSWWTCSPAWQARQHKHAPCVSPSTFPCTIALAGRAGSSLTSAVLSAESVLGRTSWRSHRALPGWISKACSHRLPCHRTSLYPWQVYSTIKPTGDLCDHLDYKSALLIHLFLS